MVTPMETEKKPTLPETRVASQPPSRALQAKHGEADAYEDSRWNKVGFEAEQILEELRQNIQKDRKAITQKHLEVIIDATVRAEHAMRFDLIPLAYKIKSTILRELGVSHVLCDKDYLSFAMDLAVEGLGMSASRAGEQ